MPGMERRAKAKAEEDLRAAAAAEHKIFVSLSRSATARQKEPFSNGLRMRSATKKWRAALIPYSGRGAASGWRHWLWSTSTANVCQGCGAHRSPDWKKRRSTAPGRGRPVQEGRD